jgi:methylglutamate dehydrogenase subunit D
VPDFALQPRSGLEHLLRPGVYGAGGDEPGVAITLRADLALALVMGRKDKTDDVRRRLQERFGIALPMTAQRGEDGEKGGTGAGPETLRFIWAGPGRWLAVTSTQTSAELEAALRSALSDAASVVTQTDGRCVLYVSGPRAREMLSQGVPVDIDPRVFGPGHAALTLAGHVNVHLWQLDPAPAYAFAVPRSFGASFCEWLFAAAAKYGVLVRPPLRA